MTFSGDSRADRHGAALPARRSRNIRGRKIPPTFSTTATASRKHGDHAFYILNAGGANEKIFTILFPDVRRQVRPALQPYVGHGHWLASAPLESDQNSVPITSVGTAITHHAVAAEDVAGEMRQ